jgi:hypothetical protein
VLLNTNSAFEYQPEIAQQWSRRTSTRRDERMREREGGIAGYPVPLSMTTAGRAVASMAVGSGEFPSAHASAEARWRSIAGRDLAPVRPIESTRGARARDGERERES